MTQTMQIRTRPSPPRATIRRRHLARVCLVALVAAHAVLALFPFRFDPPRLVANEVDRTGEGVLRFGAESRAETAAPPVWLDDAVAGVPVVVDLEVRAAAAMQGGPARILTVSDGTRASNLTVGQHGSDLVVRVRRPDSDVIGRPDFHVDGAFAERGWVAVQVSVAGGRVDIAVGGRAAVEQVSPGPVTERWDDGYRLALGNEFGGARPWLGEVRTATITVGDSVVDYLRPGELDVPDRYWLVPDRGLDGPLPQSWRDIAVDAAHLVSFVPVGAAFLLSLRPGRWRIGTALGATVLLAISLTAAKALFDLRHPSLADPLAHTLGGGIGILASAWWDRRRR